MDPSAAAAADDDDEDDYHATTGGMEPRGEEDNGASTRGVTGRLLAWRGEEEDDDDAEDSGGGSGAGANADEDDAASSVSLDTISNDSILIPPEPTGANLASLLRARKLILVVDLDHTLINSTRFAHLSDDEKANGFTERTGDDRSRGLFRMGLFRMITKLRPFVHEFLREASAMFEMHVYTLGNRNYATAVAKLLDPDGAYFGERIISSGESSQPDRKSLGDVFGWAPEMERAAVVILDDTAEVWKGYRDNLIEMERYLYFASSRGKFGIAARSLAERNRDESEREGALAVALRVLRRVHGEFFSGSVCSGSFADVREVIRQARREVLRGCTVAFTGVIPSGDGGRASDHPVWRRAEQLGATCADDVGEGVTHVVAGKPVTRKALWAQTHGKFLVDTEWINAAHFRWSKPEERMYPVEDDASAGAAPNPGGIAGEKEGDLDAEDSGGGSGADDAAAAVSHGATSTDSIVLPPEPTSGHLASLLRARKLILVVDLDHTLVNSTADYDISGTEYVNGLAELVTDDPGRGLFILDHASWFSAFITKLRPFVHGFLREASAMFEMHVYTLGDRDYAAAVAKLLDPDGVYFGERIISRDESPQPDRKSLDVVFGSAPASAAERAAVVILDDTAEVWEGNSDNLIEMERYHYFASSCRDFGSPWECTHSLSERGVDESERDGALAAALRVLRRVHAGFFAGGGGSFVADVREVIRRTRREVLRGCTVAFTRAIASDDHHSVWRRAEQLGATCADDVGPAVTHVVATNPTTFKAVWAQVFGKFLVNPEWINAAHFRWSKPKEEHFPVRW
uniref:RNA polymerase II C-terminal domain phosphatase-like n=1 Tax=Oryza glumipatula TaxID=40148 RepID=A0A0D9YZM6_9ORYZ